MTAGARRSPLHDVLVEASPRHTELHGMPAVLELPTDGASLPVMLADASSLPRMGVKGPQAETWLRGQGIHPPAGVNAWTRTTDGVLIARLGRSEFFLEDAFGGAVVERCRAMLVPGPGLYPVLRQDAALVLAGPRLNDLLVQTCSVDFKSPTMHEPVAVMTSMIGVSVLAICDRASAGPVLRLWCDGTFGPYLWETLLGIAHEEGGGAVGLGKLFPGVPLFPNVLGHSMVQERGRP